jgi:predicted ester cyclase
MSIETNKALIRRYRKIHNGGNLDELDEIISPTLNSHNALPGLPPGAAGDKLVQQAFLAGFPDGVTTTEDMIAEGDKVMERYTLRGTHQGTFMGIPATGKPVTIQSIAIFRIADGKIIEQWGENDGVGLLTQLGVLPPPG